MKRAEKFDEFARRVLEEVRESGEVGITAFQIAQRLSVERSRVSMALYALKKLGVVENFHRNIWKTSQKRYRGERRSSFWIRSWRFILGRRDARL